MYTIAMDTTIFKAYDIRGIYPASMNDDVAAAVARACVMMFEEGEIVVGYDARHGSKELSKVVMDTIGRYSKTIDKNMTARSVGMTSTPMFYFLVNHFKAVGGCMITASHDPKNYNGMKVVKRAAEMVPGTEILEYIKANSLS